MFKRVIEALAVGDAVGMPTEFMTREKIKSEFGLVDSILSPSVSFIHSNLKKGEITDDTGQNLYLIERYCRDGEITIENTVSALVEWVNESGAEGKGYIGPSSLKALKSIQEGADPFKAGSGGTTCGAPMRALAPALCAGKGQLAQSVYYSCVPTHNTSIALEAAMAVAFAIRSAAEGSSCDEIIESSFRGARKGLSMCENHYAGASTAKRLEIILSEMKNMKNTDEFLDFIYYGIGTGMEANEVAPAIIGLFAWAKEDVWLAIRAGASIGGDTDSIAALCGALCALFRKGSNIPQDIVNSVLETNNLDVLKYNNYLKRIWRSS